MGALRRLAGEAAYVLDGLLHRLDPRGVELILSQLSLWFALVFLVSDSPLRPQPVRVWSAWCMAAAVLKLAGVLASLTHRPPAWSRGARILGDFMGMIFWFVLTTILFWFARGGIAWGGYLVISLAQGWAGYRAARNV